MTRGVWKTPLLTERFGKFVVAALSCVLMLGSCANPSSSGGQQSRSTDAPVFEVETFDGGTFALAEHRGTPVVINFWESW